MRKNNMTRREFLTSTSLALLTAKVSSDTLASAAEINAAAKVYPVGPLEPVPAIRQRPEWRRFIILVWQWQNDVRQDGRLYELAPTEYISLGLRIRHRLLFLVGLLNPAQPLLIEADRAVVFAEHCPEGAVGLPHESDII